MNVQCNKCKTIQDVNFESYLSILCVKCAHDFKKGGWTKSIVPKGWKVDPESLIVKSSEDMDSNYDNNMKLCPFCAEEVKVEAIKCKHCGEWLSKPEKPKKTKKELQGLGGWLTLVGIILIYNAIFLLGLIIFGFSEDYIPDAIMLDNFVHSLLLFYTLFVIKTYFSKKTSFSTHFIGLAGVQIFVTLWGYLSVEYFYYGEPWLALIDRIQLQMLVGSLIRGIIFIPYMLKSKRVENTFIKH